MAHVGLNGLSNRHVGDDDEFDFGALPDDESDTSRVGEEIDAVNEETFGSDFAAGAIDDLEEYSKQTAGLRLEESGGGEWSDEPTCSVSAPDASQLPIPPFHANHVHFDETSFRLASSYDERSNTLTPFQLNLGTVDSLWKNASDNGAAVWQAPDIISTINRSAFDFIHKPDPSSAFANDSAATRPAVQRPSDQPNAITETPKKSKLAPIPKGALTLEEIEKEHLRSSARCSSVPVVPPIPSEGALTLEAIEKQMLLEAAGKTPNASSESRATDSDAGSPRVASSSAEAHMAVPSRDEPEQPRAMAVAPPVPSFPAFPMPMFPPFVMHAVRAHLMGQLPELPPGIPPIPPQMRAALLASGMGPPPPRMMVPPPMSSMGPAPFRPIPRPPFIRPGQLHPMLPPHLLYQQQHQMARFAHNYFREQQLKRAGLPSGKTISDFAFDPYAGFMSRKECEWLIKIQVLQCQGSGLPYEDDFYYTSWKQRHLGAERRAEPEVSDVDVPTTATANAHHYVPPTFAGSLGKPTLSSANNPRQLIDVNVESVEEDERNSSKGSTQKRLRALLMQLESVATLVLECDDRRRHMQAATLSDELHAQLKDEIGSRIDAVIGCLCAADRLPSALVVRKGRQFFARALLLANKTQQLAMLSSFFSVFPTVLRKVASDELSTSLLSALASVFCRLSKEALVSVVQSLVFDSSVGSSSAVCNNSFGLNVAIALLMCSSRKRCNLAGECARSALCAWLSGRGAPARALHEIPWKAEPLLAVGFTLDDVFGTEAWLARCFGGRPDSVASALRKLLKAESATTFAENSSAAATAT